MDRVLGLETGADDYLAQAVRAGRRWSPASARCCAASALRRATYRHRADAALRRIRSSMSASRRCGCGASPVEVHSAQMLLLHALGLLAQPAREPGDLSLARASAGADCRTRRGRCTVLRLRPDHRGRPASKPCSIKTVWEAWATCWWPAWRRDAAAPVAAGAQYRPAGGRWWPSRRPAPCRYCSTTMQRPRIERAAIILRTM